MFNVTIDIWYIPDSFQLGVADPLCASRFAINNPNIFYLVCTRVSALAREQRAVWLFVIFAVILFFDYLSELREDEALKTLAYYHANGNA